ncbi:MAG: VacB/RNase II family 3'-5' exoribonuclease [Phycisphaerales bacterium]|nr:VacB/RNase II family 3'-5' exoribonuclease [Phycisphaerales bacterium]
MPLRYLERIVDHLAHDNYQPANADALARDMRVDTDDDREAFKEAVSQLVKDGRVLAGKDGLLRLPVFDKEVVGRFRRHPRGFGFLQTDRTFRDGDLFVPAGSTGGALTGDRVRAAVIHQGNRSRGRSDRSPFVGRVIEILERCERTLTGVLKHQGKQWLVEVDGRNFPDPVIIRDPHAKNAKAGDKVAFEFLHYPEDNALGEGVIVEVLGDAGRPDVETLAVIVAHGLRTEFPPAGLAEARETATSFVESVDAYPDREDLSDTFTITIDPPDAKDFDDAITLAFDPSRHEYTLGVHIADVAHFVRPGSAMDVEAQARGNSVYLPRLVIPMLPETLSNGVCSLQEGVVRLCRSVFMTYDDHGKVLHQRASSTVIKSDKRMTYLEAQALIDGDPVEAAKHARTDTAPTDELVETLRHADRLAKILRARRLRDGMITLDLPDVDLVFDEDGHVIDAVPEDNAFTHTIIEMFMVEANEAVARIFADLRIPLLRRIHPEPVRGDVEELDVFARAAGLSIPEDPTAQDLQKLLAATRDIPAGRAVHFAVLRTLTKASYSPALIGHYALASDHYAHFTSPIRRYPDLTVHRTLAAYLERTDNGTRVPRGEVRMGLAAKIRKDPRVLDEAQLVVVGQHCSETEVESEAAERELREFLVLQYLQENHLGDEMEGLVTGIVRAGVFVSLQRFLAEGLVPVEMLPSAEGKPDSWVQNESTRRLVARRSGASVGLGDLVTAKIIAIDLVARQMELVITKLPARAPETPDAGPKNRRGDHDRKSRGKGKSAKGTATAKRPARRKGGRKR